MSYCAASGVRCSTTAWPFSLRPHVTVSAPGNPLKRLSTVRFSCTITTMCWIAPPPKARSIGLLNSGAGPGGTTELVVSALEQPDVSAMATQVMDRAKDRIKGLLFVVRSEIIVAELVHEKLWRERRVDGDVLLRFLIEIETVFRG